MIHDSGEDGGSWSVRLWLVLVAAMVVATLVVGGATRLTESGLSIVEWKPVTGIMPPVSDTAWQAEFDKYKVIPQYRELNRGMSLDQFKTIYWWEWAHRLLGRAIGVVFIFPFLYFLWRGRIAARWRKWLWMIFGLGVVQGAVGWWMVSSGLSDRVSVSQYRLAFHMTLACVIYAAIVWTLLGLSRSGVRLWQRAGLSALCVLALVIVQIYFGALVAGLDAGLTFNTWPHIDGVIIPSAERLWFETPWWRNLFENSLTVQFIHRMMAYLLAIVVVVHLFDLIHSGRYNKARHSGFSLAALMALQIAVGILTLLHQVPIPLALMHQLLAIAVLTAALVHLWQLTATANRAAQDSAPVWPGASPTMETRP